MYYRKLIKCECESPGTRNAPIPGTAESRKRSPEHHFEISNRQVVYPRRLIVSFQKGVSLSVIGAHLHEDPQQDGRGDQRGKYVHRVVDVCEVADDIVKEVADSASEKRADEPDNEGADEVSDDVLLEDVVTDEGYAETNEKVHQSDVEIVTDHAAALLCK